MTTKRFTPERGQFFWYIEEVLEEGLPDLQIVNAKYDPRKHKKLVEDGNCYLTKEDALQFLIQ